ncbi:uncharacterized protein [Dysidea avara]|uniref:uncharacterized protein isoform X2 n=1 Tax=Dysidea avara TaxID=196820 RepID=UPI00332D9730
MYWKGQQYVGKKLHSIFFTPEIDVKDMERMLTKFCEEIKLISVLKHENVIKIVGIFYQNNGPPNDSFLLPVLIMEKMPFSLTKYIETFQQMPEPEIITILHDVSRGLTYLHDKMVIHGDLSSNNILLTSNFCADFGSAQVLGDSRACHAPTKLVVQPGTPSFMPPEALKDPPCYTVSVDVFSLGCVIIHLTTCQWPTPEGEILKISELDRRQMFISMMSNSALLPIVKECLEVKEKRIACKDILQFLSTIKCSKEKVTNGDQLGKVFEMITEIGVEKTVEYLLNITPESSSLVPIQRDFQDVKPGDHLLYKTKTGWKINFYVVDNLGKGKLKVVSTFLETDTDPFIEEKLIFDPSKAEQLKLEERIIYQSDILDPSNIKKKSYRCISDKLDEEMQRLEKLKSKNDRYSFLHNNSEHLVTYVKMGSAECQLCDAVEIVFKKYVFVQAVKNGNLPTFGHVFDSSAGSWGVLFTAITGKCVGTSALVQATTSMTKGIVKEGGKATATAASKGIAKKGGKATITAASKGMAKKGGKATITAASKGIAKKGGKATITAASKGIAKKGGKATITAATKGMAKQGGKAAGMPTTTSIVQGAVKGKVSQTVSQQISKEMLEESGKGATIQTTNTGTKMIAHQVSKEVIEEGGKAATAKNVASAAAQQVTKEAARQTVNATAAQTAKSAAVNAVKQGAKTTIVAGVLIEGAFYAFQMGRAVHKRTKGQMDQEEFVDYTVEQTATSGGSAAGGIGGSLAGIATGAAIGSVVPVVGTAIGGAVGGFIGGMCGGVGGSLLGKGVGKLINLVREHKQWQLDCKTPGDIAACPNNKLIILDSSIPQVRIVSSELTLVEVLTFYGDGVITKPSGIAVNDIIFAVGDKSSHLVKIFSIKGKYLSTINFPTRSDQYDFQFGLCFNSKGILYVVDCCNCRVQAFDTNKNNELCGIVGSEGSNPNQYQHPEYIAVDSSDSVYVTDYYNNCINMYSEDDHTFVCKIECNRPCAVAFTPDNHLIVGDHENDRIFVFGPPGKKSFFRSILSFSFSNEESRQLTKVFGTSGKGKEQFNKICGLAVNKQGTIYVAENKNDRLQMIGTSVWQKN